MRTSAGYSSFDKIAAELSALKRDLLLELEKQLAKCEAQTEAAAAELTVDAMRLAAFGSGDGRACRLELEKAVFTVSLTRKRSYTRRVLMRLSFS